MLSRIKRLWRKPKRITLTPLHRELTTEEKTRLRRWATSEDTQLALRVLFAHRPSVFSPQTQGDAELIHLADSARLNQLRGWETCIAQITTLGDLDEPKTRSLVEDWGATDEEY